MVFIFVRLEIFAVFELENNHFEGGNYSQFAIYLIKYPETHLAYTTQYITTVLCSYMYMYT